MPGHTSLIILVVGFVLLIYSLLLLCDKISKHNKKLFSLIEIEKYDAELDLSHTIISLEVDV